MSENDPMNLTAAELRAEYSKALAMVHELATARAAEAAQHQQEIAAKDETIDGLRLVALGWEKQRDEARARLAAVEDERDRETADKRLLLAELHGISDASTGQPCEQPDSYSYGEGMRYRRGWTSVHQSAVAVEMTRRITASAKRSSEAGAERDRLQRVNECVYEVCGCGNMADAHCMICCRPLTEHRLIPTRELAEIQRRFALYAEDLAERDRLKAALSQITALDFEKFNGRHNFYSGAVMFVKAWLLAYAALTPQGQSTDGETR